MALNQGFTDEELLEQLNSSDEGYTNVIKQEEEKQTDLTSPIVSQTPVNDEEILKQLEGKSDTDVTVSSADIQIQTDVPESNENPTLKLQTQDDLYATYIKKYPELFEKGQLINIDSAKDLGIISNLVLFLQQMLHHM